MKTLHEMYQMVLEHYEKEFDITIGDDNGGLCYSIDRIDITNIEWDILRNDFFNQFITIKRTKRIQRYIEGHYSLSMFHWWDVSNKQSRVNFLNKQIERTK